MTNQTNIATSKSSVKVIASGILPDEVTFTCPICKCVFSVNRHECKPTSSNEEKFVLSGWQHKCPECKSVIETSITDITNTSDKLNKHRERDKQRWLNIANGRERIYPINNTNVIVSLDGQIICIY